MTTSTIHGLHHLQIALPAGGEEAARRFYRDLLGLTEVPVPASVAHLAAAWFEQGEFRLHLGVDPDFHPSKKGHPAFLVSGLDEITRRLTAAGHPIVAADTVPGFRRCHVHDPAGNRLELIEPSTSHSRG